MDAAEWRRTVRLSVTEGALATAMGSLMSGVVLTGFALSLGASRLTIGILAALPALANVAQLLGARWLAAGVHRKRFCITVSTISRALWIVVLAVPLLGVGHERLALAGLVGLVAVSSVLSSLGGVAWLSWIRDLVPTEKRLGFLALRNQFDTALALTFGVAGAAFIDWWNTGNPTATGGFVCVLGVAMVCGLIGMPILNRMHHPEPSPSSASVASAPMPRPSLRRAGLPLRERNFRNLILFYISWNLAVHLANPFFVVFMLQKLGLPLWKITALQALFSIAALAANPFWTRLGRRIGTRPVVFIATACDALYPLCWLLLTPESSWTLPLIFLFGVFNTPLAVGAPMLVMRLAAEENASSYLATFNAIIGLVMGGAAILGGYIAGLTHSPSISVGVATIGGLQLIFLLSFAGRLASLALLHRVIEPGELPVRSLLPRHRVLDAFNAQPQALVEPAAVTGARAEAPIFDTAA